MTGSDVQAVAQGDGNVRYADNGVLGRGAEVFKSENVDKLEIKEKEFETNIHTLKSPKVSSILKVAASYQAEGESRGFTTSVTRRVFFQYTEIPIGCAYSKALFRRLLE